MCAVCDMWCVSVGCVCSVCVCVVCIVCTCSVCSRCVFMVCVWCMWYVCVWCVYGVCMCVVCIVCVYGVCCVCTACVMYMVCMCVECVCVGSGSHTHFGHCVVTQVHPRHLRSQPDHFPSSPFCIMMTPVYQPTGNVESRGGVIHNPTTPYE